MAGLEGICKSAGGCYFIMYLNGNFSRPKVYNWRPSSMGQWPTYIAPMEVIEWLD